jgi:hypothetical protein
MLTPPVQRFAVGARVVCSAPYFSKFRGLAGVVVAASLRRATGKPDIWVYHVDFPGVAAFPLAEPELESAVPDGAVRPC